MEAKTTGSHLTETIKRASEQKEKDSDRQAGQALKKRKKERKPLSSFLVACRRAARSRSLRLKFLWALVKSVVLRLYGSSHLRVAMET